MPLKSVVAECLSNMIIRLDGRRHLQVDKAVHNWENRYRVGGAASGNVTLHTQSPLRTLGASRGEFGCHVDAGDDAPPVVVATGHPAANIAAPETPLP
jgi:hypothetical protein